MNLHQAANGRTDDAAAERLAIEKFAVGQSVRRREDPMLVRGLGHYTDDASLPGQAYGVMVRSRNAHGIIRTIDIAAARNMPGVLAVYTGADLKGYGPLKCIVALKSRRLTLEKAAARCACDRSGTLCGRSGRLCRRRDARAGEGCSRSGRTRR